MANMGYCRFQNTLRDLQDCYGHMDDDLSEEEARARKLLHSLCTTLISDYTDEGHENMIGGW